MITFESYVTADAVPIYVKYTDVAKSPSNPIVGHHCCQENISSLCTFLESSLGHLMLAW